MIDLLCMDLIRNNAVSALLCIFKEIDKMRSYVWGTNRNSTGHNPEQHNYINKWVLTQTNHQ